MPSVDQTNGRQAHLALTGLREFWPEDQPVWIVSPSCVPCPPSDDDDPLIAGVIPYPWFPADLPQAHAQMRNFYDEILVFLTDRLNALHRVHHSRSYWHRVVGPWIFYYSNLVCHHYTSLQNARLQLGLLESIGLDKGSYLTPTNTLNFLYQATNDLHNLQLYTRLCEEMGITIIEYRQPSTGERLSDLENPENYRQSKRSLLKSLVARISYMTRRLAQGYFGPRADILLHRSQLPRKFEWKLFAAMNGRIWSHDEVRYNTDPIRVPNASMRSTLKGFDGADSELGKIIGLFLPNDVPRVFVEEYADLVAFSDRTYSQFSPRVVLSTSGWDTDEAFGHFAGKCAEGGARLVGGECSAIYGIEQHSQLLAFERAHVDRYLTWGWSDPDDPRCIPAPANRVIDMRERARPLRGKGILYAGSVALRFPVVARPDFSGYFDLQRRFFAAVDSALRSEFRVRLHRTDYGWGIERRLKAAFPDLAIDRWERPFTEALYSARLYVCDHMSTTWAKALASNTPTVIFWDPTHTPVRAEMQPVFDKGRAAGFVHDTPESAARWIEKVYLDVEDWWFDEKTQCALREFRHYIARTSLDPLKDWVTLLNQLVSEHDWEEKTDSNV